MRKNTILFAGIIVTVILLRTFLIPDVYKLDMIIMPSFGSWTYFRVESTMFTSSLQYATRPLPFSSDLDGAEWKDKKKISLYTANRILKSAKAHAEFYNEHGPNKGFDGVWVNGKLIHGNSIIDEFYTEIYATDDGRLRKTLQNLIEEKYGEDWEQTFTPYGP